MIGSSWITFKDNTDLGIRLYCKRNYLTIKKNKLKLNSYDAKQKLYSYYDFRYNCVHIPVLYMLPVVFYQI